jgi:HD superfamily phosphohydrolase
MQRLYGLKQLGLTDRVFIDASHARIHHVVGVLEQVNKLVDAICKNLRRTDRRDRKLSTGAKNEPSEIYTAHKLADIVESQKPVIRFIGLLHDLTHAPFGHTVEDEIGIVDSKHDDPVRQADAFYRLVCQLVAWLSLEALDPATGHLSPSLTPFLSQCAPGTLPPASEVGAAAKYLISEITKSRSTLRLRLSPTEVAEMFAHLGCAMRALLYLEALHKAKPDRKSLPRESKYPFEEVIQLALEGTKFEDLTGKFKFEPRRDAFMLDIVGNTVCADLLDYAGRDSHFSGLRLDYDPDRIAENFTLVSVDALAYDINHPQASEAGSSGEGNDADGIRNPFEGWCLRTAISLVSHKYRTDVPSELMNLLNVRYYLYERVIYHPTKCAAGSMLGTALQLLGWRGTGSGRARNLPENLRFVGDDVFLHDIRAALDLVLPVVLENPDEAKIGEALPSKLSNLEKVHSELVPALWKLRSGCTAGSAKEELRAAKMLLDRLMSRRYFRPVFRALPRSIDPKLQAGPEVLADLFKRPNLRFDAERKIEKMAGLPTGTITIHCPTRSPAKKVANVFLTMPDETTDGIVDHVCRLKDIASLDNKTFGDHQSAVKAVEQMYGSMWRLNVYVAPEHLERWEVIAPAAGQVIFEAVDVHHHFSALSKQTWRNDPSLEDELRRKGRISFEGSATTADLTLSSEILGQIVDQFLKSGRIPAIAPTLYNSDGVLSGEVLDRMEDAIMEVITEVGKEAVVESAKSDLLSRSEHVFKIVKTYVSRIQNDDKERFYRDYPTRLEQFSEEQFQVVASKLEAGIVQSVQDGKGDNRFRGAKYKPCLELLDKLLDELPQSPAPRVNGDLFGDAKE